MKIVVTGANGFIGRNLVVHLQASGEHEVILFTRDHSPEQLSSLVASADVVFHLAGVNRPETDEEFFEGNVDLTRTLCEALTQSGRKTPIVFSSSIHAVADTPYGCSKRQAEQVVERYADTTGARAVIYRLPNVFGKWSRPEYNSVVATFCHNIARGLPITVTDPGRELELAYVDDVVASLVAELDELREPGIYYHSVNVTHRISLGELADRIRSFKDSRTTLLVPDMSDALTHKLYATYLSFLDSKDFAYNLDQRVDHRGALAEFVKAETFGQLFVSRTKPGVTRGNHYHHTKTEKFLVVEGEAIVRFRKYGSDVVFEYRVRGEDFRVIDIPPGYTHSIENVGTTELVTLFWASEIFDATRPDTYPLPVDVESRERP